MYKTFCALVLSAVSLTASAEFSLKFGGVSYHFHQDDYTNSFHRIVNPRYGNWSILYARNSFDNDVFSSTYFKTWNVDTIPSKFNLHLGLVYGYNSCTKKGHENGNRKRLCPIIVPELELDLPLKPTFMMVADALVLTATIEF